MPVLSNAPVEAIDALVQASRQYPNVGAWLIELDKFYQKQDILTQ